MKWLNSKSLKACLVLGLTAATLLSSMAQPVPNTNEAKTEVLWLGQAGFRIKTPGGQTIVIDPWITGGPKAPPTYKADIAALGKVAQMADVSMDNLKESLQGLQAVTGDAAQGFGKGGHALHKFLVNGPLHKQACTCAADLARVLEHCHGGTRYCRIQVGIGKHNVGRLAAQLHRQALHVAGGGPYNFLAHFRAAGKCNLVDSWVVNDQGTR